MAVDYTKRPSRGDGEPARASSPAASSPPAVSLSKVTLTKSAPSISLTKAASRGRLHVNLNWNVRPEGRATGGFLKRLTAPAGIDLDLGCLFELSNGDVGVVQALGGAFGSYDRAPYIHLDGDDRSGASSGGENLYVNLEHAALIRRVLVFACIYDGVAAFDQADGVVTVNPASGPPIEVRLDESAGSSRMCAIALLENRDGQLSVQREVQYIKGAQDALDRAYGFGLKWHAGRK